MKPRPTPAILLILTLSTAICSCGYREQPGKGAPPIPAAPESTGEAKGSDPRAAFETSGMVGGLSGSLESAVTLLPPAGRSASGVSLALGGALSTAAIARSAGLGDSPAGGHVLVLASGSIAALSGPALAIASSGDRILVSCVDRLSPSGAAMICFKAEGEGERILASWKKDSRAASRLVAVPGGRVAVSEEASLASARIYSMDALSGAEAWSAPLPVPASDLAYAPGALIAASGTKLVAFDEATGAQLWSAALTAKARSLSAGNGVAIVIAENGSLSAFSLADGKGIGAAPGPYDPAIRPVCDGQRAIAALASGGAAEVEIASGQTARSWAWSGPTTFLAADRDRVYAGVDGLAGKGILIAPRAGESEMKLVRLAAGAFGAPIAVNGARGGLLLLLLDGSLVLVGKEMESVARGSALEAAISPKAEIGSAIAAALGRFKPAEAQDPTAYLRFDLFTQGMPVDKSVAFTAFAFDPESDSRKTFYAKPSVNGSVVAIYNEEGREIAASIDELGSTSSASAYMRKGKRYWIVAGWTYQAEVAPYRVFAK
jgi:outer membrane protein assembly factor BamB